MDEPAFSDPVAVNWNGPGTVPVSLVIATRDRATVLARTLSALGGQSVLPVEWTVVDASTDERTREVCAGLPTDQWSVSLRYHRAAAAGAASQRNEGVAHTRQPFVLFADDDILPEPECFARLWAAIRADERLGGVNATITNQQYHSPGRPSRLLYRLLHGHAEASYAGRVIGPGLNLLPADYPDLPEVVPVEWLNTTCTLYRREALPDPPFPAHFTGYSLGEDIALSLHVARRGWTLANARTARIFHDSQPGTHKDDPARLACMEMVNRHYIMTEVLGRRRLSDYGRLALLESFHLVAGRKRWPAVLRGQLRGAWEIVAKR
jgi:glycosyltransferase involved in cell wall biosynthesis